MAKYWNGYESEAWDVQKRDEEKREEKKSINILEE